jgi:hypothetical protein
MKMGKYDGFQRKPKERKGLNPIWRGVGCILLVVVPLITYGLTILLAPFLATTGYVPYELLGHVNFPAWVHRAPFLSGIASFIASINNLWLEVVVFIVLLLLLTGFSSLIYVAIFQFIGPPRYSENDAPPPSYKAKPYKR